MKNDFSRERLPLNEKVVAISVVGSLALVHWRTIFLSSPHPFVAISPTHFALTYCTFSIKTSVNVCQFLVIYSR